MLETGGEFNKLLVLNAIIIDGEYGFHLNKTCQSTS